MSRGALIAAMEGETAPLTRGWQRERGAEGALWSARSKGKACVAACAGAGPKAAQRAWRAAEAGGRLDWAASMGWAGALHAGVVAGKAYRVRTVIDAASGERFSAAELPGARAEALPALTLVSAGSVAGLEEKRRLRSDFGADLVDMEAATVARLAHDRGIPFYCVKGVSDGPLERLPDLNRFLDNEGGFRTARFAGYALLRPRFWGGLIRMGLHSARSANAMAEILATLVQP